MKKLLFVPVLTAAVLVAPNSTVRHASANGGNLFTESGSAIGESNLIKIESLPDIAPAECPVKAGLLFDAKKKRIVWEKELNSSFPIASLTKMMVALITVEDIKNGRFEWDTKIKVTKEACHMGGSKVFLKRGEVFSVADLMKSAMIASGNDACYLLGQFNAGSEEEFVKRMNKRAAKLGMTQTRYSNCTGLPDRRNHDNEASPYDLLLLANELLKYPEIVDIAGRPEEYIRHGKRNYVYRNHNKLAIEYHEEVDGLKTGFTNKAGFCIVATGNRGGRRLVSVALGARKSVIRNNFVAEMMNNYYSSIGVGKLGEESIQRSK